MAVCWYNSAAKLQVYIMHPWMEPSQVVGVRQTDSLIQSEWNRIIWSSTLKTDWLKRNFKRISIFISRDKRHFCGAWLTERGRIWTNTKGFDESAKSKWYRMRLNGSMWDGLCIECRRGFDYRSGVNSKVFPIQIPSLCSASLHRSESIASNITFEFR